jgi:hypothetical protein
MQLSSGIRPSRVQQAPPFSAWIAIPSNLSFIKKSALSNVPLI